MATPARSWIWVRTSMSWSILTPKTEEWGRSWSPAPLAQFLRRRAAVPSVRLSPMLTPVVDGAEAAVVPAVVTT